MAMAQGMMGQIEDASEGQHQGKMNSVTGDVLDNKAFLSQKRNQRRRRLESQQRKKAKAAAKVDELTKYLACKFPCLSGLF